MDWLMSLDPTAVCVTLLVVALTLLWVYVSMSGARREQPNLSALYQQTTLRPSSGPTQTRSPRAGKSKGKPKQVEGSPRPSSQKSSAAIEPAAVTLQKKPTGKTEQPPASNGGGKLNSETPVPKQTAKSKKKKQAVEATGTESVTKVAEEGNEGEWQTQLSRGQLKALRKKQRKEKEKAEREEARKSSSSDTDSKQVSSAPSTEDSSKSRQKDGKETAKKGLAAERPTAKNSNNSDGRGWKGKGAANSKQKTPEKSQKASAEPIKTTDNNKPGVEKAEHDSFSCEPAATAAAVSVSIEEALKDAARSTSTSPETDDAHSARTDAPFAEVVASRHRNKKPQQKATAEEPSSSVKKAPEATQDETKKEEKGEEEEEEEMDQDEDWVVIDGDSLT